MAYNELYDDLKYMLTGSNKTPVAQPTVSPYDKFLTDAQAQLKSLGTAGSGGTGANYMGTAKGMLGEFDNSGFDAIRQAYEQAFGTQKQGLEQSYGNLRQDLDKMSTTNLRQFQENRAAIGQQGFNDQRDTYRQYAQRGLGGSGLQQLAMLREKMEMGKTINQASGQFYDANENIATQQERGAQQYNQSLQGLSDTFAGNLANTEQQEIQYKNQYQKDLVSIANEIASQKQAQAAAAWQSKFSALQASLGLQEQQARTAQEKLKSNEFGKMEIATSDFDDESKILKYMDAFDVDRVTAAREIKKYASRSETSLVNKVFEDVQKRIPRITSSKDFNDIVGNIRESYKSGLVESNEIVDFLSKNIDLMTSEKSKWFYGFKPITMTQMYGAMGKGDSVEAAMIFARAAGILSQTEINKLKKEKGR